VNLGRIDRKYGSFLFLNLALPMDLGIWAPPAFEGSVCPLLFDIVKNCCAPLYVTIYHLTGFVSTIHSRRQYHIPLRLFCLSACLTGPRPSLTIPFRLFQTRFSQPPIKRVKLDYTHIHTCLPSYPIRVGSGNSTLFSQSPSSAPFPIE
jgi:hypothetical protein